MYILYLHYTVQFAAKKYSLKLFAIFWAAAWNFNAKFHTPSLYSSRPRCAL